MERKILFYLFLSYHLFLIFCHKCGTDFLKLTPGFIDTTNIIDKRKLDDYTRPINIIVDITNLKSAKNFDDSKKSKLEEIFSEITDSFSSLISIYREISNDDYTEKFKQNCDITHFDQNLTSPYMKYDLLIFATVGPLDENILAAATPCLFSKTYRPMAGVVIINEDLSLSKYDFKHYMKSLLFREKRIIL